MVEIPEGKITLRDDRIGRTWTVRVNSFLISSLPVTQESYQYITGQSPSYFKGNSRPVESLSWIEAVYYCNMRSEKEELPPYYKLGKTNEGQVVETGSDGYRLPSEAEWEYACRAGTGGTRYGELNKIAWYKENSKKSTQEVGKKEPNKWGLYDMLGNVWEWCSDIYDERVYGSYRIIRGGGWNDDARGCLVTNRRRSHPVAFKIEDLGFRVARNK